MIAFQLNAKPYNAAIKAMSRNVQILALDKNIIRGLHSTPIEKGTEDRENLLIIMMHGFPGDKSCHNNLYHDIALFLRDNGYHSLRFDFRGCGESNGWPEHFTLASAHQDFQSVLNWARKKGYARFVIIGEGLSAPIALMNAHKGLVVCMALLWPMLDLPRIAKTMFQPGNPEHQLIEEGYILINKNRIGLELIKEMRQQSITPILKALQTPLLVMHGTEDKISPVDQLDILREQPIARRVEITTFDHGTHGLPQLNHRKTMYFHIKQFIQKYG